MTDYKNDIEIIPDISNVDLTINNAVNDLITFMPEHKEMLGTIQENLPEIQRASSLFYKTQSQFMDNMLTISHPTPIRNLRQIAAEYNRTKDALRENHFKFKKQEIELKIKQREYQREQDELKKELLLIEINEILSNAEVTKGYISGAIRKLTNYSEQYKAILKTHNIENFNEVDFEQEEEKYHIMKAFDQAVCAARTRNGVIDEGNMIYLTQIGINGSSAQKQIHLYLIEEGKLLSQNQEPSHEMYLEFLQKMYEKYKGSASKYAHYKGMIGTMTKHALIKEGDTRLLKLTQNKPE